MPKTVFILGAGASREAGAPLMRDFLDVAQEQLSLGRVGEEYEEHFRSVFRARGALQPVHSKSQLDLHNIEAFFGACEMAKTIGAFPGMGATEVDRLLLSLRILIARTLELSIEFQRHYDGHDPEPKVLPAPPHRWFAELISHLLNAARPVHSVTIITFNYDLVIDFALWHKRCPFDYGLGGSANPTDVQLLKLHGSLNWAAKATAADGLDVGPIPVETVVNRVDAKRAPINLPILGLLKERAASGDGVSKDPVLVPPSWDKMSSHRSLSRVWQRAAAALAGADNVFVMGYSMPDSDSFFRYLYALGSVGDTLLSRFWVFDPDETGDVRRRFAQLLGPGAAARFEMRKMAFRQGVAALLREFGRIQAGQTCRDLDD